MSNPITKNPKASMTIASVIGILLGIFFTVIINPPENYHWFMVVFAIIGIGIGNLFLLVIYEIIK